MAAPACYGSSGAKTLVGGKEKMAPELCGGPSLLGPEWAWGIHPEGLTTLAHLGPCSSSGYNMSSHVYVREPGFHLPLVPLGIRAIEAPPVVPGILGDNQGRQRGRREGAEGSGMFLSRVGTVVAVLSPHRPLK